MDELISKIAGAEFTFTAGWIGWFILIVCILVITYIYEFISAHVVRYVVGGRLQVSPKERPAQFVGIMLIAPIAFCLVCPGALLSMVPIHFGSRINSAYQVSQRE